MRLNVRQSMSVAVKVFDWILRVLGLLVLLGLITAFAGWVVAPSSDTRPPKIEEITDLQSFGDGNWETFRIDIDDLAYYSVRTGYESIRASGPCEHYFDRNGNYIATNGDIGNDVQPWLLHPSNKKGIRTLVSLSELKPIAEQDADDQLPARSVSQAP